jgi:hypothetical protein
MSTDPTEGNEVSSDSDPGLWMPPLQSDDVGRKFERESIPVSLTNGLRFVGLDQLLFQNTLPNAVLGGVYDYDKKFDPDAIQDIINQRKQVKAEINDEVSRMPTGILPGIAKFGMSGLASLADPTQAALFYAAPEFIGSRVKPAIGALTENIISSPRLASGLAAATAGAVSGATFGLPQAATHLAIAREYEDDFTSLDALHQVGTYALWGAGLEGFTGLIHIDDKIDPVQPINIDDHRQILESTVGQLADDNYPDVTALIQKALENGRRDDNLNDLPKIEDNINKLTGQLTLKTNQVEDFQNDFNTNINEFKLRTGEFPVEDISAAEMADRLESFKAKPSLSEYENFQEKAFQKIGIVSQASDLIKRNPITWTDGQEKFIRGLRTGKEPQILENENSNLSQLLKDNDEKIKAGQKSIVVTPKEIPSLEKADRMSVADIQNLIKNNEDRLAQIDRSKKTLTIKALTAQNKDIDKARTEQANLDTQLKDNIAGRQVMNQRIPPVTGTQAKSLAKKMISTDNEAPLDTQNDTLSREVEKESDEPSTILKDDEETVDQLLANKELTEDEEGLINTVNDELGRQEGYTKLIKDIVSCVTEKSV